MTHVRARTGMGHALLASAAVVLLAGCGDDAAPQAREDPNDPVTVLCRAPAEDARSACSSSYFACHGREAQIIDEDDLPRNSSSAAVLRDYVKVNWSDWEPRIKDAAERGCRAGLQDEGRPGPGR